MKEILDADEGGQTEEADILDELLTDKHLPNFKFHEYPLIEEDDGMESPRIKDEVWSNFEV